MSYIIDADWIIQATRGHQGVATTLKNLASARISVSWLTVGEVYEVAFNTPHPAAVIQELRSYLFSYDLIGVDASIIERFAEIRAFLRRRGQMISDLDVLLAAIALDRDLTVLTFNLRHFERIPDLRIYRLN